MARVLAGVAALAAAGFLAWQFWLGMPGGGDAGCGSAAVAGGAIGGPLSLTDETGRAVTEAELFQKPALVYFGFSFCPDVCPLDNLRNAEAADLLKQRGLDVATYFITVDPARDTPQVMADYTDAMHPDMIGLTGTEAQISAAASAYAVYYRANTNEGEYYSVDHTTFTYLMRQGGAFADFFKRDDTAEAIAEKAACLLSAAG